VYKVNQFLWSFYLSLIVLYVFILVEKQF
jgi:hypothetical protein